LFDTALSRLMPDEQLADLGRLIAAHAAYRTGVVVCPILRASARTTLEGLGVAYADSRGHLHLPALAFRRLAVSPY
jgi:hypothetical protein